MKTLIFLHEAFLTAEKYFSGFSIKNITKKSLN